MRERSETRRARTAWRDHFQALFVRRIGRECREVQLRVAFSPFGMVVDTFILKRQGAAMGYAFVRFRRPEDVERVL